MEKLYNARLSYKGEGNFTFTLSKYGELTIYAGKDIFVKGMSTNMVETLRQLRALKLEHQLNAKPDGCYRVIDLEGKPEKVALSKPVMTKVQETSLSSLKANLIKTTGPIVDDIEPEAEEPKTEAEETDKEQVNSDGDTKTNEPSVPAPKEKTQKPKTRRMGRRSKNSKK